MTAGELSNHPSVASLIDMAIAEDIGDGDITSRAIFTAKNRSHAFIRAKESGVLCGCFMAEAVYSRIDPSVEIRFLCCDGDAVNAGDIIAEISGPTASILAGERIALNFMQRLSGIATRTAAVVELLSGTGITILDTRKTLPGYRLLDKYAVRTGGGTNHRMGLFDMVMIKDNHIEAAGGISEAVKMVRDRCGSGYMIEVEASTPGEVTEALESGVDIIMLDNMSLSDMEKSVEIIDGRAKIEVSGNMEESRIMEIRHLKIDYISMGALTHSVKAFDLSMRFYKD
jgi:nicotinate-nucleotide pyrophosphorylase (carboxylating)